MYIELNDRDIEKINRVIAERYLLHCMSKETYEKYHGEISTSGWNSCLFINNIIIDTDRVKGNNNILYYTTHELAHYIMHRHQKGRLKVVYLCVNELEAEIVAREVMKRLDLSYDKAKIQVENEKKKQDLIGDLDENNKVDYLKYFQYEAYKGYFKDKEIERTPRQEVMELTIKTILADYRRCLT